MEIDFEVFGAFDERGEVGVVDEIVESEGVAGVDEVAADSDDFIGGRDGFEDLDDDAVGREEARRVEAKGKFVNVHESESVAGEGLQVEEGDGVGDDAGSGVFGGFDEIVLRAAAEEKFVGEDAKAFIEDGLTSDEFFVHTRFPWR